MLDNNFIDLLLNEYKQSIDISNPEKNSLYFENFYKIIGKQPFRFYKSILWNGGLSEKELKSILNKNIIKYFRENEHENFEKSDTSKITTYLYEHIYKLKEQYNNSKPEEQKSINDFYLTNLENKSAENLKQFIKKQKIIYDNIHFDSEYEALRYKNIIKPLIESGINVELQKNYNEFVDIKNNHSIDFYFTDNDIIIEATSYNENTNAYGDKHFGQNYKMGLLLKDSFVGLSNLYNDLNTQIFIISPMKEGNDFNFPNHCQNIENIKELDLKKKLLTKLLNDIEIKLQNKNLTEEEKENSLKIKKNLQSLQNSEYFSETEKEFDIAEISFEEAKKETNKKVIHNNDNKGSLSHDNNNSVSHFHDKINIDGKKMKGIESDLPLSKQLELKKKREEIFINITKELNSKDLKQDKYKDKVNTLSKLKILIKTPQLLVAFEKIKSEEDKIKTKKVKSLLNYIKQQTEISNKTQFNNVLNILYFDDFFKDKRNIVNDFINNELKDKKYLAKHSEIEKKLTNISIEFS